MNFCKRDIPGASLNRRLLSYETYWPRFDATREALCIACIRFIKRVQTAALRHFV